MGVLGRSSTVNVLGPARRAGGVGPVFHERAAAESATLAGDGMIDTRPGRPLDRRERLHGALAITPTPGRTRPTVGRRRRAPRELT